MSNAAKSILRPIDELSREDYEFLAGVLLKRSGISLGAGKVSLVQSRLRTRLVALNLPGFSDYRAWLESLPASHEEWQIFVNQLTTNKTDWFREVEHIDFLIKEWLPGLPPDVSSRALQVWSGACSTGEEPYTLAMALHAAGRAASILATDLDTEALATAKNGVYQASRILEQVPREYMAPYFAKGTGDIKQWTKVRPVLRQMIRFSQLNLTKPPFRFGTPFDVVFLRNVLIYFTKETVETVVNGIYEETARGGILVIGHSESLQGMDVRWRYLKPSIYIKD